MAIIGHKEEFADEARISNIAKADEVRWWKKPNLRFLYLILIPCGLGVEWTSGFDSSMMNSLQAVEAWRSCEWHTVPKRCPDPPEVTCWTNDSLPQISTTRPHPSLASSTRCTRSAP